MEMIVVPRVGVLLFFWEPGSANAGLPATSELAARILKRANERMFTPPWVRILNAVYGAMAGHQGLRGNDSEQVRPRCFGFYLPFWQRASNIRIGTIEPVKQGCKRLKNCGMKIHGRRRHAGSGRMT